ncbi:MAG: type II toxin-antitoxin system Phd/YefM family antitoxin [Beutenbergiaceae bacterium]
MSEIISQRELRNDSGRIMRGLDEGRSYILTRHSVPVGEVLPLRRRRYVDAQVVSEIFQSAPGIDSQRLRQDLDSFVDQDASPYV